MRQYFLNNIEKRGNNYMFVDNACEKYYFYFASTTGVFASTIKLSLPVVYHKTKFKVIMLLYFLVLCLFSNTVLFCCCHMTCIIFNVTGVRYVYKTNNL